MSTEQISENRDILEKELEKAIEIKKLLALFDEKIESCKEQISRIEKTESTQSNQYSRILSVVHTLATQVNLIQKEKKEMERKWEDHYYRSVMNNTHVIKINPIKEKVETDLEDDYDSLSLEDDNEKEADNEKENAEEDENQKEKAEEADNEKEKTEEDENQKEADNEKEKEKAEQADKEKAEMKFKLEQADTEKAELKLQLEQADKEKAELKLQLEQMEIKFKDTIMALVEPDDGNYKVSIGKNDVILYADFKSKRFAMTANIGLKSITYSISECIYQVLKKCGYKSYEEGFVPYSTNLPRLVKQNHDLIYIMLNCRYYIGVKLEYFIEV